MAVQENPSWLTVIECSPSRIVAPACLSRLMFGRYAGWAVSAALQYIATTIGTWRLSSSLSKPRGSVSLMPAAHWLTVLNVAGATSTAFAGGSSSVSCGRRGLVRTAWPVTSARLPRSSHVAAVWVGMPCSSHPSSWSCRAACCQSWTGGAAHMIQYRTRGASVSAVMRQLARRNERAPAGPERMTASLAKQISNQLLRLLVVPENLRSYALDAGQ